jgi:hypothetical protein
MGSIPDDDRKYDVHLWEVHTMTMGKYTYYRREVHSFNFGKCKVPANDCKNVKKTFKKLMKYNN